MNKLWRMLAGLLLAIGIGLVSCTLATGVQDVLQAGLISLAFGVGILFTISYLEGRE